jgi:hypothetical protein
MSPKEYSIIRTPAGVTSLPPAIGEFIGDIQIMTIFCFSFQGKPNKYLTKSFICLAILGRELGKSGKSFLTIRKRTRK